MNSALPLPPDGAQLSGLDERRLILGNPALAYCVPKRGLLFVPDGAGLPAIRVDADVLTAFDEDGDASRTIPVTGSARDALSTLWPNCWLDEPGDGTPVVVCADGLLRVWQATPELDAWLLKLLSRSDEDH